MLTTDRFFLRASLVCGAAFAIAATPAQANSSSAAAAAVDVSDAAEQAQSPLGNGDAQFRQLFASWQTLDVERTTPADGSLSPVPLRTCFLQGA